MFADLRESGPRARGVRRAVSRWEPRERRSLCCDTRSACDSTSGAPCCDERKLAEYREEIRARVVERVSSSRHVSTSDLEALFPECPGTRAVCSCESKDRPTPCVPAVLYPVLAVMELLARNPNPLMASSQSERCRQGFGAQRVYSRALPQPCSTTRPASVPQRSFVQRDAGERQDRAVEISALSTPDMEPGCSRSCSELTAEFPGMDFGKLTMNKGELKIALRDQLCLHSKFDASLGLQALSSLREEAIDRYRPPLGRAAGSWTDGSEARAAPVSATPPSGGSARSQRDGQIRRHAASEAAPGDAAERGKCPLHVFPLGEDVRRLHPNRPEGIDRPYPRLAERGVGAGRRGLLERAFFGLVERPGALRGPERAGYRGRGEGRDSGTERSGFPHKTKKTPRRLLFAYLSLGPLQRTELGSPTNETPGSARSPSGRGAVESAVTRGDQVARPWWKLVGRGAL
ncbi:hypothetical protein Q5P01_000123 [Channa striata]|uniref:Uncharacterized protein n=1 Tax=Channa striata TaxID=64152 RepID=A0AA88LMS3_CHASR|nr:hypothetical protein Q5P01_000123 [Channa striata]